ncbi:MAG: hypothetical protein KDB69_09175, partial [Acidimicrobiia bacterium]|nr:hypothetical protein [Acidimicrobiia bacterium]
ATQEPRTTEPLETHPAETKTDAPDAQKTDRGKSGQDEKKDEPHGPRLAISSPEPGTHVERPTLVVEGVVSEGAVVFLGDVAAEQDGTAWSMTVELEPGKNRLYFKAIDAEGNKTKKALYVWYDAPDTEGPQFEITSPRNGSETTYAVIIVRGKVEAGSKVLLGDIAGVVDGEKWELKAPLDLGKNELVFVAFDEAGNESTATLLITRIEKDESEGPRFSITSPANKSETDDQYIRVTGKVAEGSRVYHDGGEAHVEGTDWVTEVKLRPGWNELWFKAVDQNGDKTKLWLKVYLVTDDAEYKFTAEQKYGSCGDEVPYDIFYGTGKPGSVIEVGSPFGDGRTEVDKHGHWELKVFFEGAPVGEKFNVTVYASTGETKAFHFIATGGDGGGGDH